MLSSLAAMVQVSLRRSRATWPIVAAAGLICVLATSLMAAGPMYANAVSLAGLHRVLGDAPVADANVQVSLRAEPDDWDAIDGAITTELERAMGTPGGTIQRFGRSDSFALPGAPTGALVDLVELGFAEGLEDHATLVDGAWPAALAGSPAEVPVVVTDSVAARLGLTVGQRLLLESRVTSGFAAPIRIEGIAAIADPADPIWWGDAQVVDGIATSERFATHGPFFTTPTAFFARANAGRAAVGWRAFPNAGAIDLADTAGLRSRLTGLHARLEAELAGTSITVETGLPGVLADADRSLLVSRTGVLLLTAQFVILAAYAVLLSATLLVEHRRMDTAMLRSRGAGPTRIATLALVEGLALTVPAALLGPWIAATLLRALEVVGPLADIGLPLRPVVSFDAFVASGLAAAACLIALLIPALPRIRSFSATHGRVGRAETRTAGQRFGLDVALLAVAFIGLWQLRTYGAPLTRSIQGTLGIDPLLVATPAIGVLAGAVVALRIVPLIASMIERLMSRRRSLVPALGARQLARRPLRYTRAALLLMLAVSMGVFAITYTRTWTDSQRDQAAFQVGADVRAAPGRRATDLPVWALERAYADLPGVTATTAIRHASMRVPRVEESGEMFGLDAVTAGPVALIRSDLIDGSFSELLAPLAAARPDVEAAALPDTTRRLAFDLTVAIDRLEGPGIDPETGEDVIDELDPRVLDGRRGVQASIVVRDAAGHLYRFGAADATFGPDPHRIEVPLGAGEQPEAAFAYPLELLAVSVGIDLPPTLEITSARVGIERLESTDDPVGDDATWRPVSLATDAGWRTTAAIAGSPHQAAGHRRGGDDLALEVPVEGLPTIRGVDRFQRGTVVTFASADLDGIAREPIPVIATDAYLEATARSVGDTIPIDIGGANRDVRIDGAMRAIPSVDASTPALLIDLPTLMLLSFESSDATDPPEEWWLAVEPGAASSVLDQLRALTFGGGPALGLAEREAALASDPVALGVIGALAIGVAAAAAFAVVGFIVSASVSARERVTEFALLRALGLSSGQLSGWLSLESATLAVISLVAGTALGLLVAWVALPFVTVTRFARPAFPPVEVTVPWTTIALLEIVGIAALAVAIAGLTWSLARVGMASALRMGED